MTDPTTAEETLSQRLNVFVTPTMKARVDALRRKQGRRTEAEVIRAAVTAYLNKEERR